MSATPGSLLLAAEDTTDNEVDKNEALDVEPEESKLGLAVVELDEDENESEARDEALVVLVVIMERGDEVLDEDETRIDGCGEMDEDESEDESDEVDMLVGLVVVATAPEPVDMSTFIGPIIRLLVAFFL